MQLLVLLPQCNPCAFGSHGSRDRSFGPRCPQLRLCERTATLQLGGSTELFGEPRSFLGRVGRALQGPGPLPLVCNFRHRLLLQALTSQRCHLELFLSAQLSGGGGLPGGYERGIRLLQLDFERSCAPSTL
jgi:hypothetical protein